jgi:NADH-quinone oxidoreductase subunit J
MTGGLPSLLLMGGVLVAAAGVWMLMPQRTRRSYVAGLLAANAGLIASVAAFGGPHGEAAERFFFWIFAGAAVLSGLLMVTSRNPVYAALWFAVATLGVCGLFMLQKAPFLAAATIIVYAGAIIVTFLFVIMMAQQSGATIYDQRSRTPVVAVLASFFLLGALLWTYEGWQASLVASAAEGSGPALAAPAHGNPLSQTTPETFDTMRALGRSLFGDYLFAVELAGTLLLVAAIGAIAVAPRRSEGQL